MTQQNETKGKKIFKKMSYHYRAVELRYEGKTYQEIADILTRESHKDFNDSARIRRWFMSGGILEKDYSDYAKKENERRRRVTLEELKKIVPTIPIKFQEVLERKYFYINKKTGDIVETDKNIVDKTTVTALLGLCKILGFQIDPPEAEDDPLDKYLEKLDEHDNDGTSPKTS